ncbi:abortive infection protein [Pediococcus parvulus]|jgi:predicted transcriptional regulator of viral defense system|nr:abortive infection protein [Pediococcus parvulus]
MHKRIIWLSKSNIYTLIIRKQRLCVRIYKEVMIMSNKEKILAHLKAHNGMITVEEAASMGVNRYFLSELTDSGQLERVNRGVYIDPAIFEDEMAIYQYRFGKGIFSYNTALYLHGLTDRTPRKYDMTFPLGYHSARISDYNIRFYMQSNKYYQLGIESEITPNGNTVRVYSIEKTLCDLIRGKNKKDSELISMAMNGYAALPNKDVNLLIEMAQKMNVETQIRTYLEVLL